MAPDTFNQLLTRQVGNEFAASHQYIAVAVWFDSQDLPQLAKHFYRQSLEERNHAMMMVRYILDRDLEPVVPAIGPVRDHFADVHEPWRWPRSRRSPSRSRRCSPRRGQRTTRSVSSSCSGS